MLHKVIVHPLASHFGRYPINVLACLIVVLAWIVALIMLIISGAGE